MKYRFHTEVRCEEIDFKEKKTLYKCTRKPVHNSEKDNAIVLHRSYSDIEDYSKPYTNSYFTAVFPRFFPTFFVVWLLKKQFPSSIFVF